MNAGAAAVPLTRSTHNRLLRYESLQAIGLSTCWQSN